MTIAADPQLIRRLTAALNLEGRMIRRLVIDVTIEEPVKLYIEEYADTTADGLVAALTAADVEIVADPPVIIVPPLCE